MKHKQFQGNRKNAKTVAKRVVKFMDELYQGGHYPLVDVISPANVANQNSTGEFALPEALSDYLVREFADIIAEEFIILVKAGRKRRKKTDIGFMDACEEKSDHYKKKLFLFPPERIELSCDRLAHYTKTDVNDFQEHILITNYEMHMEIFKKLFPKAVGSKGRCQMPAWHAKKAGRSGITIVNMGVGPANAKTLTDQLAVLRPSCLIMIGHCGGLKSAQNIGDFLLADRYMRDDHVLDVVLPKEVPITSTLVINNLLLQEIQKKKIPFRIGTVFTTNNRDWEYKISHYRERFAESRAYGIDMESSVICAQGFRYKIPHATLLMVSDKPLHGQPKLAKASQKFYQDSKKTHVQIAIRAINNLDRKSRSYMKLSGLASYPGSDLDTVMW